jgi:hypothetical protein
MEYTPGLLSVTSITNYSVRGILLVSVDGWTDLISRVDGDRSFKETPLRRLSFTGSSTCRHPVAVCYFSFHAAISVCCAANFTSGTSASRLCKGAEVCTNAKSAVYGVDRRKV